jgi:putative tryptophan/tyrosine transport system substrate-binding protein
LTVVRRMRRREFIGLLGGAVAGWPLASRAQQRRNVARIGLIGTASLESPDAQVFLDAIRGGLRERGYIEGQNIVIEARSAGGRVERFPALADELVRLEVDVIIALNSLSTRAAQQATATIPIVAVVMGDPVGDGFVASLARPGGNITGLSILAPELLPKLLALLKEALPTISRLAALWHPHAYVERTMSAMLHETEAAARTLGVRLRPVAVQSPDDLDQAFATIAGDRAEALVVFPSPMLFNERRRIVDLATDHRLPFIANARQFADLGGLMAYGPSIIDLHRRAVTYVDRILKGAKPSDLPVEQPTTFELVLNLKSAKALGLTISPSLLLRADYMIE